MHVYSSLLFFKLLHECVCYDGKTNSEDNPTQLCAYKCNYIKHSHEKHGLFEVLDPSNELQL